MTLAAGGTACAKDLPPSDGPTPLADAIRTFNANAEQHPIGKTQPPLTEDEVIAAIRWSGLHRKELPVTDEIFRALQAIPERRELPHGFELEKVSGYEPNDQVTFDVWSLRLRIPREPYGTTCVTIREQYLRSRLIGPEERKVIHEWSEKERKRGGIGSFERVEWLRAYHRARAEAAARDQAKH